MHSLSSSQYPDFVASGEIDGGVEIMDEEWQGPERCCLNAQSASIRTRQECEIHEKEFKSL